MKPTKACCVRYCDLPILAIGLCNKHWRRTRNYGSPAVLKWQSGTMKGLSVTDRFWLQLKKTEDCWLWSGATDQDGYGIFSGSIAGIKFKKAHRFSYTLHTGELIPPEKVVMHSCDNPRCVNPDHLSLGTNRENMLDKIAKGRANTPRSVLSPVPLLSAEQRQQISLDPRPYAQIAVDFGVSGRDVGQIKAESTASHFELLKALSKAAGEPCVIKECDHSGVVLGLCPTHWNRCVQFGSPAMTSLHSGVLRKLTVDQRFNLNVQKKSSCWLWTASVDKDGYGRFRAAVGSKTYTKAHRFAYAFYTGEIIPDDVVVMHSCDVPQCVNPDHLSLGTYRENMTDKIAKGRANISKAEKAARAKLTNEQVQAIFKDSRIYAAIANDYGVAASTIGSIKQGKSWASLGVTEIAKAERVGQRGDQQWSTHINADIVREIRSSTLSGKELAAKFGISPQAISSIKKRRNWKHVE